MYHGELQGGGGGGLRNLKWQHAHDAGTPAMNSPQTARGTLLTTMQAGHEPKHKQHTTARTRSTVRVRHTVPHTVAARHQRPGQKYTRRPDEHVAAVTRAAVAADVAGEALARPRRRQTPARVTAAVATLQRLQRTVRGTLPAAGALRRCALLTQLALLVAAHCTEGAHNRTKTTANE